MLIKIKALKTRNDNYILFDVFDATHAGLTISYSKNQKVHFDKALAFTKF